MKNTITLKLKGMSCAHCAGTIQQALAGVPGVEQAEVNFAKKKAFVTSPSKDKAELIKVVQAAGYDAV